MSRIAKNSIKIPNDTSCLYEKEVLLAKGKLGEMSLKINPLFSINLKDNEFIFHAGTCKNKNKIFSNGGRVLNFVVKSKNFKSCREDAIELINQVDWKDGFYRKDIGYKVIDKWE